MVREIAAKREDLGGITIAKVLMTSVNSINVPVVYKKIAVVAMFA